MPLDCSDRHVLVAANPKSGAFESTSRVAELVRAVQLKGFQCTSVQELEQIKLQSERLFDQGKLRAVVSAGGDGTADALANLLSPRIPIVLFPLGTENLLAKHFDFRCDVQHTCEILHHGIETKMDVGSANGTIFLVMASCGFDAQVVNEMHAIRSGHINRWSYAGPVWNALSKYRFPRLRFTCTGIRPADSSSEPSQDSAAWIFVFNVPRYAASLDFCPDADPHDGLLDICTFDRGGIAHGVGYLSRLYMKTHRSMRGFRHLRTERILIESSPHAAPFQVDGDPGGMLPLEIKVLKDHFTLLTLPSST